MKSKRQYQEKCQRWTLERIDFDADVVRVENVPLQEKLNTKTFFEELAMSTDEILEWWDIKKAKTNFTSLGQLRSRLQLGKEQKLAEGMVFWVQKKGNKITKIIHATRTARELSKLIYGRLIGETTDSKEAES